MDPQTQSNRPRTPDLDRLTAMYNHLRDHEHDQQSQLTLRNWWDGALRSAAEMTMPPGAYVAELGRLGLRGKAHTGYMYARRLLEEHLGYSEVRFERFESPGRDAELGRIEYVGDAEVVRIRVASFLQIWTPIHYTVCHEAAHPAAGHVSLEMLRSIRDHGIGAEARAISDRRLARQPPLLTGAAPEVLHALHEAEANLRAEYGILHMTLDYLALEAETPGQPFR